MDLLLYPVILGALCAPAAILVRRRPGLEALAVGTGVGVIVCGGAALARCFVLLPSGTPRTVGILTLLLAAVAVLALWWLVSPSPQRGGEESGASPQRGGEKSGLALVIAACAALTLGLEAAVPHFGAVQWSYDWWMHFDLAHFYQVPRALHRVYQGGNIVPSRTPLYNLLGALTLTLVGDRFPVFQVLTAALGWLWILPLALLARRHTAPLATTTVALLASSPLVLWTHTYTWPKGLVTFFVLLALERLVSLREAPPAAQARLGVELGLAAGAAVMTHAGFVGYLLPLYGLLVWDGRRGLGWRRLGLASVSASLVALPWYAWAVAEYGWRAGLFGYPEPALTNPLTYLGERVSILATSLLPISFPVDRITGALSPAQDYFLMYLGTAAGIAGVGFLLWSMARLLQGDARRAMLAEPGFWFAVSGPAAGTLLLSPLSPDNAGAFFIPGLLVLALLTVRAKQPPAPLVAIGLVEVFVFEAVFLAWIWSGAAAGQPNAHQAAAGHISFLGIATWPAGVFLLLVGFATCVAALRPWLAPLRLGRPAAGRVAAGPARPLG